MGTSDESTGGVRVEGNQEIDDPVDSEIADTEARLAALDREQAALLARLGRLRQERFPAAPAPQSNRELPGATVTKDSPVAAKLALFRRLFRGREDVYARRWESFSVYEGRGYLCAELTRDRRLFLGAPVTVSDPALMVEVADYSAQSLTLEVHNPTTKPITAQLSPLPEFDLVPTKVQSVTVPAGGSVFLTLK